MTNDQKRAFLAVLISVGILFGWQYFFVTPQQQTPQQQVIKSSTPKNPETQVQAKTDLENVPSETSAHSIPASQVEEYSLSSERGDIRYIIQNNLIIKDVFNDKAAFEFAEIFESQKPLQIFLVLEEGQVPLLFNFEKNGNTLKGVNSQYNVSFSASVDEKGKLRISFSSPQAYKYRFVVQTQEKTLENQQHREFVYLANDVQRVSVGDDDAGEAQVKWMGLDYNYHLFALAFDEPKPAFYKISEQGRYAVELSKPLKEWSGDVIFVKKNYDDLMALGNNFHLSVDFGFLAVLSVPILRGLQFFYTYVPNYGVAIILLTIFIRMLTFPLQYKSFKSMKKMQKIQPELSKIREKFKDDPKRMQTESMDLFKRAGANPLSGCLPLILQMPVFFAFYKVLYSSVELVGSPFFAWIRDLSEKDPYYVLPILMAASMFLQQKLTPTPTTDPTQKKVMMFMPLIFALIMKDLPAGLSLYIFISTLFGIAQQMVVYRYAD